MSAEGLLERVCDYLTDQQHADAERAAIQDVESKQQQRANGQATAQAAQTVIIADFYAYMPDHLFIFIPTRELWTTTSVNARCELP